MRTDLEFGNVTPKTEYHNSVRFTFGDWLCLCYVYPTNLVTSIDGMDIIFFNVFTLCNADLVELYI